MTFIVTVIGILIFPLYFAAYAISFFLWVILEVTTTLTKTIDDAMNNLCHYAEYGEWL